jgi:GTP-binding protein
LHPNLGVVDLGTTLTRASCWPISLGLIEGAHEGHGLGTRFLGHVERTAVLIHLIDGTQEDVVDAYKTIRHELKEYGGGLGFKPELVALNKIDALLHLNSNRKKIEPLWKKLPARNVILISAVTGQNMRPLLYRSAAQDQRHARRGKRCG